MGKAEAGSAKYQSKLLKASGLQKLKYYCQLCLKQCRDANGFKSHLSSPSHLSRISNLSKDGKGASVVLEYLREFEREFLRLLKINHGTKKVDANKFYQEYILYDKNHVHMNATRWSSLTAFVRHLGSLGKVKVESDQDADEFNLTIQFVDEHYMKLQSGSRESQIKTDEESLLKFVNSQVEAGKKLQVQPARSEGSSPIKKENTGPVALSLKGLKSKKASTPSVFGDDSEDED